MKTTNVKDTLIDLNTFEQIELSDKGYFEKLRFLPENQFTALSFESIYTWRNVLGLSAVKRDDFCAVFSKQDNGFFCPMGDISSCEEFTDRLIRQRRSFKIMYLSKEQAQRLKTEKGADVRINRNLSEYIYDTKALAFENKPVYHFRRRVRNFQKKFEYSADLITSADLPELYRFVSTSDESDRDVLKSALDNYNALEMKGIVLRGGKNLAFLIGYKNTRDMFTMSLVKATPEWLHIADAVCEHELAKRISDEFPYVNMEEDLGIPGLRTVKELTNPIKMLDAWEACFN